MSEELIETAETMPEEVIDAPAEEVIETAEDHEPAPVPEDDSAARKARREAQNLRQRLHDAAAAQQATTAELDALRAAVASRDAADAARALDDARARVAAAQRIPAGLAPFLTGTTPDELAASAVALSNELRFLTESPLLGIDAGPLRSRTLDAHHAAITRQAAAYDSQQGASSADRMTQAIQGK